MMKLSTCCLDFYIYVSLVILCLFTMKRKRGHKVFLQKFVSQNAKISRLKKLTQGMIQNQQN